MVMTPPRTFPVGSILSALIDEIAAEDNRTPEDVHTEAVRRGLMAMVQEREAKKRAEPREASDG